MTTTIYKVQCRLNDPKAPKDWQHFLTCKDEAEARDMVAKLNKHERAYSYRAIRETTTKTVEELT